jgi:hypothetical protein
MFQFDLKLCRHRINVLPKSPTTENKHKNEQSQKAIVSHKSFILKLIAKRTKLISQDDEETRRCSNKIQCGQGVLKGNKNKTKTKQNTNNKN